MLKNDLIFMNSDFNLVFSIGTAVHDTHQGDGPHCKAVFTLQNSAVYGLQFANLGRRLIVAYEHGQVRYLLSFSPFEGIYLFLGTKSSC